MSTSITPPVSFTFTALQQNLITWTLTNQSTGLPVTGATLVATLYSNRNQANSTAIPGTISDPNLSNLSLPETNPGVSGIYTGIVPAAFNPVQAVSGFLLVITASSGSTLLDTWTIPAVVIAAQNLNNLVQLSDVKNWLNIELNNTDDDGLLQILITGFSQYVINRTGIKSFTQVNSYSEIYNGNGANRMFLKNYPIQTVSSVQVGAYNVLQSTGLLYPGWFIEQDQKSIAIRYAGGGYFMVPYSTFPQKFTRGTGNVQVNYTAGYTSVPADLYECAMKVCAINMKRQSWLDIASRALSAGSGSGHVAYRSWSRPPEVEEVLRYYQRRALV